MKYALVCDWLVTYAGAERMLQCILDLLPDADLFALIDALKPEERFFIHDKPVHTSFLQHVPFARSRYRHFFPLMPLAIEQLDLSSYDVVLSTSHAFAKGVLIRADQMHVAYVHTPVRWAWDLHHDYLREAGLDRGLRSMVVRLLLHYIRNWDHATADRADMLLCSSQCIARRIWRTYRRRATVVHPPVEVDRFQCGRDRDDFYFAASRFVPYKRMMTIAEAFAHLPGRRLVMIGQGPELRRVASRGFPNVQLLGFQPFDVLHEHMRRCRAFIFAAEEDFGLLPLEAQACGAPVIAYNRGGVAETVVDGTTGVFFDAQTPEAIAAAVERFERSRNAFEPEAIRENAMRFRPEIFMNRMRSIIERAGDRLNRKRRLRPSADRSHLDEATAVAQI
jgi:glycosyltransferase involved in cell wall biosynthesis